MQPIAILAAPADPMESRAADLEDFDQMVRLYWPRVFRFAVASLRDPDAAGSIAQDCLVKAYRTRHTFRGDCSVSTWLMQIAVNLLRDYSRNRHMQFWKRAEASALDLSAVSQSIADRDASPEGKALAKEQVEAVWNATEKLPQKQRTVFLLRFVEDMDLLEIVAVTGMKEGTVKTHLFRAVQSVRLGLEEGR